MSSLMTNFDEVMARIHYGRDLGPASFEPIYYLVFPPKQILEVKRYLPAWMARLRNEGWEVHRFSIAEQVADILGQAALTNGSLQGRLEDLLTSLEDNKHAIVLVTDLEALHPYLRIGAIEGQLYSRFHVPTVFFYPGERTGKTRLKFLGFYPDDGNYRSNHVGG